MSWVKQQGYGFLRSANQSLVWILFEMERPIIDILKTIFLNSWQQINIELILETSTLSGNTDSINHGNTDTLNHSNTDTIDHGNTGTLNHGNTGTLNNGNTDTLNHYI